MWPLNKLRLFRMRFPVQSPEHNEMNLSCLNHPNGCEEGLEPLSGIIDFGLRLLPGMIRICTGRFMT